MGVDCQPATLFINTRKHYNCFISTFAAISVSALAVYKMLHLRNVILTVLFCRNRVTEERESAFFKFNWNKWLSDCYKSLTRQG